jgi:regulator of protease activity HflC (stomatin/prohibitin superfamily)
MYRNFLLALVLATGCTRVNAGHAGIKINLAGSQRGVEDIPISTGWVFYSPISEEVFEYPTFVQTATWTKSLEEGNNWNEEISFNTRENMTVFADVSLSYQLVIKLIPAFYVKFRSDDLDTFTHGFLRNVARDVFNEVGGKYSIEDVLGAKNGELLAEVRKRVNSEVGDIGVELKQLGFIGAPRPPLGVTAAISEKVQATINAIKTENQLRQAEAEARKRVAEAEGAAKSKIAIATGEAEANRKLSASITPELLKWQRLAIEREAIAKWNGQRPRVEGAGAGLLIQMKDE